MADQDRKVGRPPVGPSISHRFPTELVERLDACAAANGTTRSDLLRRGAELILAQYENDTAEALAEGRDALEAEPPA